ncbi:hypothetical protein [Sorangium sp. So ce887]|uniref:hypothetical protein n=1 Tax=Sorangium sp. So ce887 TaxID=3133324 RepID=UPI003F60A4D3
MCLEALAADRAVDGCGVFVNTTVLGGDDANPGTEDRPVRSIQRGTELARTGRGRVFVTNDVFAEATTLPSGVDIYGGFDFLEWERRRSDDGVHIEAQTGLRIGVLVEPARFDEGALRSVLRVVTEELRIITPDMDVYVAPEPIDLRGPSTSSLASCVTSSAEIRRAARCSCSLAGDRTRRTRPRRGLDFCSRRGSQFRQAGMPLAARRIEGSEPWHPNLNRSS